MGLLPETLQGQGFQGKSCFHPFLLKTANPLKSLLGAVFTCFSYSGK
jgi:hypothetical protein